MTLLNEKWDNDVNKQTNVWREKLTLGCQTFYRVLSSFAQIYFQPGEEKEKSMTNRKLARNEKIK